MIPGATIVLSAVDTSVQHTSVSNGAGEYVFLNITPGQYTLEAKAHGFNPQKIDAFVLAVNQIATLTFPCRLEPRPRWSPSEHCGTAGVTSASLGTVIATKQVNDLPLDGRNFTYSCSR